MDPALRLILHAWLFGFVAQVCVVSWALVMDGDVAIARGRTVGSRLWYIDHQLR